MNKKTGIIIIVIFLLLLLGINGVLLFLYMGNTSSKADRQMAKAQDYIEDEKYDEAIQVYKEVLAEDNTNVDAYLGLAEAYKSKGELKKARSTMEKGYQLTQDEALSVDISMITWEEAGRKDRAIEWSDYNLEQAVRNMTGIAEGDIMLSDLWEITDFHLYENNLQGTNFEDLSNLPNITSLHLYNCQITSLEGIDKFDNLEELYLSDNQITDLEPLQNLTNLIWLDVSNNNIENIEPLKKLKKLTHLDLSGNWISDIEVLEKLSDLEYLNLSSTQVSDLSALRKLSHLDTLYLDNMSLDDISILSSLTGLRRLSLAGDYGIHDVSALKDLAGLEEINLANTGIDDISTLAYLKKLSYLNITGTYVTDTSPVAKVKYLKKSY